MSYHIRWDGNHLDWESHHTREDAERAAKALVRAGETYTIEEHGPSGVEAEQGKEHDMLRALVIGQRGDHAAEACTFLRERGCEIRYAPSYLEAWDELEAAEFGFDLVLCPIRMGKSSGLHLAELLQGSAVSLFYSYAVEAGIWWMPAVRNGRNCFGTASLRSEEFGTVLDEILKSARAQKQLGRVSFPVSARRAAG